MENLDLESSLPSIGAHDLSDKTLLKIQKAYEFYFANEYNEALNFILQDTELLNAACCQVLLGNCYQKNDNIERAIEAWEKAISLSPDEYCAYSNIGNIYYSQNEIARAIEYWTRAFTIQPESWVLNLNLAVAYNKKGAWIKSTKFFERYIRFFKGESNPQNTAVKETLYRLRIKTDFYFKKLQELKSTGTTEDIISLYKKIISTYSNIPAVYFNLGSIYLYNKQFNNALELFLILHKHYSDFKNADWNIAEIYEKLGQKDYAYCFYKRCERIVLPRSTKYRVLMTRVNTLMYTVKSEMKSQEHLEKARAYEADNLYEDALFEYENSYLLAPNPSEETELKIRQLGLFTNPDQIVV